MTEKVLPTPGSALSLACYNGDFEKVKSILNSTPTLINEKDKNSLTALTYAVNKGFIDIASYMVDHGALPLLEFPQPFNVSPQYAAFFQNQIAYRARGDWEGIMRDFYVEDPIMISYDFVLRGREAIMKHFIDGNAAAGKLIAFSVESYIESFDNGVMLMRSNVLSQHTLTKACDSYYMEGSRVKVFFAQTSDHDWVEKTKNWALKWIF